MDTGLPVASAAFITIGAILFMIGLYTKHQNISKVSVRVAFIAAMFAVLAGQIQMRYGAKAAQVEVLDRLPAGFSYTAADSIATMNIITDRIPPMRQFRGDHKAFCRGILDRIGDTEQELDRTINTLGPRDSVVVWSSELYSASAHYLRLNCYNVAFKGVMMDEEGVRLLHAYDRAARFVHVVGMLRLRMPAEY